jgi:hypothetical protein
LRLAFLCTAHDTNEWTVAEVEADTELDGFRLAAIEVLELGFEGEAMLKFLGHSC